jgi:hypothetical protein
MLLAVWKGWARHSNLVWQITLVLGFGVFLGTVIRRAQPRHLVPAAMLLGLPPAIVVHGVPIAPPGWMFLLPLFLTCSMYGIVMLVSIVARHVHGSIVSASIAGTVLLAGAFSLASVSRQEYLSSWEHELVDIERILDECEAFGRDRCALVTRYVPSKPYYVGRRGWGRLSPPHAPDVERVFIAVGTLRSLDDLWHEGIRGYGEYGPPRIWRSFSRSTLYAADRTTHSEGAANRRISSVLSP